MDLEVERAGDDEGEALAGLLAAAFAEDPIQGWMLPGPRNNFANRRRLFRQATRLYLRDGLATRTAGSEAAALWGRPGVRRPEGLTRLLDDARGLLASLLTLGTQLGRSVRLYERMMRERPAEPHWYLAAIGTHPNHRRKGAAGSLLRERLAECDETGTLAYLESSSPANVTIYERHGFEVIRETRVEDSPPLWLMSRTPRA
ncbi:MAG: GNAT family N-acetyltransferase [Myxococcota bacterium]|nr:GNAT family N-acetyltransferase [Myxococcota bacterium]